MPDRWGAEVADALDPAARGVLRVAGGAGTGKTALLTDIAAAHVGAGADAAGVLLLTGRGRLPAPARSAFTAALLAAQRRSGVPVAAIRQPPVRSLHSYAFAVLQTAAHRAEGPPPRLVTGVEQDSVIRELLTGDGPDGWPAELAAALATDGFVGELRDLLARCAERGVDPAELIRLGRRHRHPEWAAAGRFAQQYEQVMLLRAAVGTAAPQATVPALGAAELVGAALEALAADPDLLAAERERIRLLLVDDAQQLDPQAALLVRVLAAGVRRTVIAGDPNQAVFGFRGADPGALLTDRPDVVLTVSHRCAPAIAAAVSAVAARLPGAGAARHLTGTGEEPGAVAVRLADSERAEEALIVDAVRRAHLVHGIPWSQIAVVVRSVPRAAARLPRALTAAGVPTVQPGTATPLAGHPAVTALLGVLGAAVHGLDGPAALALLTGPIGRVDPVSLRQLRRLLPGGAGFADELVAVLTGRTERLPAAHAAALQRVRAVLAAAATCHADGRDPHYTLWQAWQRSGLQRRWLTAAERGGAAGVQAGRDLDAVTALFDATADYVARTGAATVPGLLEHLRGRPLTAPAAEPAPGTEAVSVLSAHAALGRQWDLVVVAGLQEGLWPNTVPRGGVLNTQRLLDLFDGIGPDASTRAPLLAEERRLLVAALGRARRRLLITAVDGADGADDLVPSAFVEELRRFDTGAADTGPLRPQPAPPVLTAAGVVGRLRGTVCAPDGAVDDDTRARAAAHLARLARAGVPGADPADWHGRAAVSTEAPLWRPEDGRAVALSPSSLQTLLDCPLRWLMERHGASDARDLRSTIGSVLHALFAEVSRGGGELRAELDRAWAQLPFDAQWYSDNELARHTAMLDAFEAWRLATRDELTVVGTEIDVEGELPGTDPVVRLHGRIDRLERDPDGALVVVDVKTGKTPATRDAAQQHAQLATYQLAVRAGLLPDGDRPGGARLVYPAKAAAGGSATERRQDPLGDDAAGAWRDDIGAAAAATAGPVFVARVNDSCRHCPVRPICPAHTEGSES